MMENTPADAIGHRIHGWISDLFPICRSLTGEGVRQTLAYLKQLLPDLVMHEVPTGTRAFDWTVPDEWNIRDAYVLDRRGHRVIDFQRHNLHVVGYSEPVDVTLGRAELEPHLYSLPDQPDAIPYVTSFYERRWGFCLSDNDRRNLGPGPYRAVIDSTLEPGSLTYGEIILPGRTEDEILISTNICHPSMANNELSGPTLATALAGWLSSMAQRRYTYRIVFIPETIGAIVYLSRHLDHMRRHTVAGYVLTCVGDGRAWSLMPSRLGDTLADRVTRHVLRHCVPDHTVYSFLQRGSDERQYCSPGVDLPVVSLMRSMYGTFPEYHTSLDDLGLVSPESLAETYEVFTTCLSLLERNHVYKSTTICEPQLGRRGLKPTLSAANMVAAPSPPSFVTTGNVLVYADGTRDLVDLAERVGISAMECAATIDLLLEHGLVERVT